MQKQINNMKQISDVKKKEGLTVSRDVFRRKPKNQVTEIDESVKFGTNDTEIVNTRNKMITDIIAANPNQKITFSNSKPKLIINDQTILIPMTSELIPTMERTSVCKYLVNYKGCTHDDIHLYSSFSPENLQNKSIKFIKLQTYGVDYPIVSKFNLIYCKKCVSSDNDMIKISEARGMLKFISSESTRESYSHVLVPDYIPMDKLIFVDGDDTWVNLSLSKDAHHSITELKDHIITTVPRKNYLQVFALPPPFEDTCLKFDDFGPPVFISSCTGYDDGGFMISADVESDNEFPDDQTEVVQPKFSNDTSSVDQVVKDDSSSDTSLISFTDINREIKTDYPHINLIIPMREVADFNNNIQYFKIMGYDVDVSMYGDDISVRVVTLLTLLDKSKLLESIQNLGHEVKDINDITVCKDNKLVHEWAFIIINGITKVEQNPRQIPISRIDICIAKELERTPDEMIVHILTMLEKAYLQQKNNMEFSDIIFDYACTSKCSNISLIDLKVYHKSNFSYNYRRYNSSSYPSRDVLTLLIYLKYCSIIPVQNIYSYAGGIIISNRA
ncbi:VP8 [Bercke-Baary Melophagus reo-like virus]|nr:VP8 [Bercke-Baary Melophagus reo-like virus]UJG27952.1 VP8 [Bercke-Baary Melophagus reo-like virus]